MRVRITPGTANYPQKRRVCMFVHNNFKHDSRVLKEARTLAKAGYDVRVIAILDESTQPYEKRDGFRVIRVARDPLHYKTLRALRRISSPANWISNLWHRLFVRPYRRLSNGQSTLSKYNKLICRLRLALREIDRRIKEKGAKGYIKDAIETYPGRFFTLGWIQLLSYYLCRCVKKVYCWAADSPAKTVYKYIRKALYWTIRRPAKNVKAFFYRRLRAFFMIFHKPLSLLDYYYRSLQIVNKEPADIYHAHDLNTLPTAYWAKKKIGGKLVYDSHELYVERNRPGKKSKLAKFLLSKIESLLIKSADHIITVSESIGQELKKRYFVKQLTVLINTPSSHVVRQALSLRDLLRIPQTDRIVLYLGSITFNRGLEELIRSIPYLNHCVVVLMGYALKPEYSAKLRQLAKEIGAEDKLYFFGPVPLEDVTGYAAFADVGAAPSKNACLSYYYSAPNKLFECIAAGLPVVGSNLPEFKKVIEGYNLGKTFNPDDPKDIADAINYVLSDKGRYDEMKTNALLAAKVFNWENESEKLLEIYRRLEDELRVTSN